MSKIVLLAILSCLLVETKAKPGNSCNEETQCDEGECCLHGYSIYSRRAALAKGPYYSFPVTGYCKTYSQEGESCLQFFSCGCASGLECLFIPTNLSIPITKGKRIAATRSRPICQIHIGEN